MRTELHGSLEINFFGTPLHLLSERAAFWPARSTLFVADLHIGKEQTFRRAGLAVPDVLTEDLNRLGTVIEQTESQSLVILGDFHHTARGRSQAVHSQVTRWREAHPDLEIILVRGNHDRHAGEPLKEWNIQTCDDPSQMGGLGLAHLPDFTRNQPFLAGHLHPKYRLKFGPENLKLPCFLLREMTLVLPAFSSFVDHHLIPRSELDQVYVIADDHVLEV